MTKATSNSVVPQSIRDLVDVPSVRTVIRLQDAARQPREITDTFVFTAEVQRHISALSEAWQRDVGQGYFLRGDFGSGKSHFLAAVAAWAANADGSAQLAERHSGLGQFLGSGRRFLPVSVSLIDFRAVTPLEQILVQAIEGELARHGIAVSLTPLNAFLAHLRELCGDAHLARELAAACGITSEELNAWLREHPREAYTAGIKFLRELGLTLPEQLVEDRHETFRRALAAVQDAGFDGLLILIDELSEFFRSKPDSRHLNEDARTLQFLGELAASHPLWIIAAVQESLESTGDIAQVTFRKIKDRFPVRLNLSTLHIRDLIAKRLVIHKPLAAVAIREIYDTFKRQFPTFAWDFQRFHDVYPVHPLTLDLLEGLGDLFSQHRGIVDFVHAQLAGDPERQIEGILDRPPSELLAPDSIYDHFRDRLAEFSDFNIYPRHIVPNLDSLIAQLLPEPEDAAMARRIIRMLVLYNLHPSAKPPTVGQLAELVSCTLAPGQPELNAEFVAEAILEPLAQNSPYLRRQDQAGAASVGNAVYTIDLEEDPLKTLHGRIQKVGEEFTRKDSRLLSEVIGFLPESISWPGPEILTRPVVRPVNWRGSRRQGLVAWVQPGEEQAMAGRLTTALDSGDADFALLLMPWYADDAAFTGNSFAVWKVPPPADADGRLRRWLAAGHVVRSLRPASPAEAGLLEPAREMLERGRPEAEQEALNTIFAGQFRSPEMHLEDAARSLRRFERIIDTAASPLLELRYPNFAQIAPRGIQGTPRLYQQLLDDFIFPGSISLQEARRRGLTSVIEGLAAPLGLVDVRAASYIFAPDPGAHPLLMYAMSLLHGAAPTPSAEFRHALLTGPFGLPPETASFLTLALAASGLLALLSHGRQMPLEFLRLAAVDTAEAVAPGEVINARDRQTLMQECRFLAPPQGWDAFGLKQQREAWISAGKFKRKTERLVRETIEAIRKQRQYAAFADLELTGVEQKLQAILTLADEIKVSYSARDGLERFLRAWRAAELRHEDVVELELLHTFLTTRGEQFIFIHHYVHHPAAVEASGVDQGIADAREAVLELTGSLASVLADEDGSALTHAMDEFRELYAAWYTPLHQKFQRQTDVPRLTRLQQRGLKVVKALANTEALDRPAVLSRLLALTEPAPDQVCRKNPSEQLLRSPVCDCGFRPAVGGPGQEAPVAAEDAAGLLENCLREYLAILCQPRVLETCRARAFAISDSAPAAAEQLRQFTARLEQSENTPPQLLLETIDDNLIGELRQALENSIHLVHRQLPQLLEQMQGRRLQPSQVRAMLSQWLGNVPDNSLVAIDSVGVGELAVASGGRPVRTAWWPLLHPELVPAPARQEQAESARHLANILEQDFPARTFSTALGRLAPSALLNLILAEPAHVELVRQAWIQLSLRTLRGTADWTATNSAPACLDPALREVIAARLTTLGDVNQLMRKSFPAKLELRLHALRVAHDPWATDELRQDACRLVTQLEQNATDWFEALPELPPLTSDQPFCLLILDAVPVDVWLAADSRLRPTLLTTWPATGFSRLLRKADTVNGIAAQLGLAGDPLEACPVAGIDYCHLTGREPQALPDLVPAFTPDRSVVIRIAAVDAAAHGNNLRLWEIADFVTDFCRRNLPGLAESCRQSGHRLIVSTDHGLSVDNKSGLTHGRGGVFEQTIWRLILNKISATALRKVPLDGV